MFEGEIGEEVEPGESAFQLCNVCAYQVLPHGVEHISSCYFLHKEGETANEDW